MLDSDLQNVQAIMDSENARCPGLNLRYFSSSADFLKDLQSRAGMPLSERAVFCVDNRPFGPHHAAADIRKKKDQPLTMIFLETATMKNPVQQSCFTDLALAAQKIPALSSARMAVIDTASQRSDFDCLVYGLSFALKFHSEQGLMSAWHDELARTGTIHRGRHETFKLKVPVKVIDGNFVLPASFYKHGQNIERLKAARPEIAKTSIYRKKYGTTETLEERVQRLSGPCTANRMKLHCNMSIEHKRISLIERTLLNMGGEVPHTFSR